MKENDKERGFHYVSRFFLKFPFENVEYGVKHTIYSSNFDLDLNSEKDLKELDKGIVEVCKNCQAFRNITVAALGRSEKTKNLTVQCSLNGDGRSASIGVYHPRTFSRDVRCPLQRTKYLIREEK